MTGRLRTFLHSLVFKISVTILAIQALALAGLGTYYVSRFGTEIDNRIRAQVQVPGTLMSEQTLHYDSARRPETLTRLVGEAVVRAVVVRRDGTVFYASDPRWEDRQFEQALGPRAAQRLRASPGEPRLFPFDEGPETRLGAVTPLLHEGGLIGHLYLEVDVSRAVAEKRAMVRIFVLGSSLCILLTTLAEVLLVHHFIGPRIRQTVRCLQEIEAHGDLGTRIADAGSRDELGELQRRVNSMIADLERRQNVIRAHAEEREALVRELAARASELERFAYTVSHDLKSPLITIQGFLELLQQDVTEGDRESQKDDLETIQRAVARMRVLLRELLELSQIGRVQGSRGPVGLSGLAREAAALVAGPIAARGVRVEIDPAMPVVEGDRQRLLEVFQNLIENAVKFMGDQAEPRVEVGVRHGDGEAVCFVRDNGRGIKPRYLDKVFDLFYRLETDTEGSGIGLAVVKRTIEVHGGRIWAESEGEGRGTTFCFALPDRGVSSVGTAPALPGASRSVGP